MSAGVLLLCLTSIGRALTLEELEHDATLSPQTFARHFAHFRFQFHAEVQSPEVFLATKSGDCDDYATLAADLLKAKGFTPRLISVRMKKLVHVVCYVEEARAYLDYNQRSCANGLIKSGSGLSEIADKVAESFGAAWESVSEFTYRDGVKRLVQNVLAAREARSQRLTLSPPGTLRDPS